ncbi:A24 family peptidase [Gordonia phosphorivorans]|uniref:A24 family peptidase n=1 Tax=Gordonia phosphorivorans TaxID=1056982 RepID=A0ABV6H9U5_9ACTN
MDSPAAAGARVDSALGTTAATAHAERMGWLLAGYLVVLAAVDARTGRLPNVLIGPLLGASALVIAAAPAVGLAALTATVPYLIGFRARGCGGGDVKLAVGCGALLAVPASALLAVATAALLTLAQCRVTGRSAVPHAPALVAATIGWWLVGLG